MAKKILVLLGNPETTSFSGEVATAYENAAREAGHEVMRVNISDMQFDPILHKGYKEIQQLEPDLLAMQDKWRWADHIVIIYPNCGARCLQYSKACLIACIFQASLSILINRQKGSFSASKARPAASSSSRVRIALS